MDRGRDEAGAGAAQHFEVWMVGHGRSLIGDDGWRSRFDVEAHPRRRASNGIALVQYARPTGPTLWVVVVVLVVNALAAILSMGGCITRTTDACQYSGTRQSRVG